MRKVLLNMTMTLDGFFCGPNGELGWMSQKLDPEQNSDIVAFFQEADDGFIGAMCVCCQPSSHSGV